MSRIFADPFSQALNAGSFGNNSYASLFGATKQPTANQLLPQIDPADEQSTASWALEKGLGGLSYLGQIFDKSFGGRAVRGALGGNANELASILPFSDTLGITNPENQVSGRDLLAQTGLVDQRQPDESFGFQDLAGMATEMALDPSMFLSLGLTGAGRIAQKGGKLADGFLSQLKTGQRGLNFHLPLSGLLTGGDGIGGELLSGHNVLGAASALRSGVTAPIRALDYGLNSILGVTPFSGAARRIGENVTDPLGLQLNRLFAPEVKNAGTVEGQTIGREMTQAEKDLAYQRDLNKAKRINALDEIAGPNATPEFREQLNRAVMNTAETAADPGVLGPAMQAEARANAASAISKMHAPGDPNDVEHLLDVKKWLTDKDSLPGDLNPTNQTFYRSQVADADKQMIEKTLPGGAPLPSDTASLTALNAARDLINQGHLPSFEGDVLKLTPGEKLLQGDRQKIADAILKDEDFGPRSLTDPGGVDNRMYRDEINQWVNDPKANLNDMLFHGDYGDLASKAVEKLKGTGAYQRLNQPLDKALEFEVPRGNQFYKGWAEANLAPEELEKFNNLVASEKQFLIKTKEIEQATGAKGGWLTDSQIEYFTRQATKFPKDDPRALQARTSLNYWKDLKASNANFQAREDIFRNVPNGTETINGWSVKPEMSGPNRTMSKEDIQAAIREQLTGFKFPAEGNPAWKQAEGLEKWLGGLPEHHAAEGVPFFSADLPQMMWQREKGMNEVQAAAKSFYDSMKRFGNTREEWENLSRTDLVSARDLAGKMNLNGADESGSIAARTLADAGMIPKLAEKEKYVLDDLKNLYLPEDVARDMLNFNKAIQAPEILKPILKAYDAMIDLTKTYLTRPFLSFHVRNIMDGLFKTWLGGGLRPGSIAEDVAGIKNTFDFMRGGDTPLIKGLTNKEAWKELYAGNVAYNKNLTQNADILGKGGEVVQKGIVRPEASGQSLLADIGDRLKQEGQRVKESPASALNPFSTDNSIVKLMTEGGQQSHDAIRISHYANLRNQGWEAQAAADQVAKYHIDYSKLSDFERGTVKRILPWYSYARGTLPVVLETALGDTGKITGAYRALTGGRPQGEFVPSYIGEGAAVPLGTNDDGTKRYLSSFGLGIEDESFKMLGSLLKGDLSRVGEQGLGMTYPWIKSPLELIFNKQLFSGRPLTDLKPYEFASLGGMLNDKQARVLTEIAANTPASRTLSTANKLTDPRKDVFDNLLGLGTGLRITDVDQQKAYNDAIVQAMSSALQGQPGIRTHTDTYAPVDQIPNLSPDDALKLRLMMNAEKRIQDLQKARKQAGQ